MNRETRFRAWDKKQNEMLQPFTTEDFFSESGMMNNSHDNCIFMQYTGLKDKNGKEIYEGDIVKCNFAWGDNVCEIVEEKGCYWVSQKNREIEDQAHDNLYWHNEGCEIIGNLYETPELLNNKN